MGYKVSKLALGDTQIRPSSQWQPGANTIAYYEFNDNINDTSGNNRNLSMKNGSFTYGTIGKYKYVDIPQSAWTNGLSNFPFDINSNTVSFWIKNPYYTKSDGNAMVADFWRGGNYGTSRLNTYSGAIKIDNVSYTISDDTKRYYVCIVYDNGQTNLYVNGEYVGANTCGLASGTTSVSFALNNAPDTNSSTYSGQCKMSQLIFESIKRTAEEVSNYYNNTKGIYNPPIKPWTPGANTIAYYPLSSNANDYSGKGNNGTVTGTISYSDGIATFNGSQCIQTPINDMPGNFTISMWIKNSTTSGDKWLLGKWGASNETQRFGMYNASQTLKTRKATSASSGTWDDVLNIGTSWHNLVYIKTNSTKITIYVDGVKTNDYNYSDWSNYASSYLCIGCSTPSDSSRWRGNISEVILENKAWTVDEISNYYNQTKGNFTNATTTIPSALLGQTYTGSAWRSSSDSDYNWSYQNTGAKGNHIGIGYSGAWFDMCGGHAGTWQGSYYYYRPHILYYYRDASGTNSWGHIDWSTYSNRYYSAPENIGLTSNGIYEKSDGTELIISVTMSCSYGTKSGYFKITSSAITWYDSFDTSGYNEISIQPLTTLGVGIDSSYQYDYPNMTFPSVN